MAESQVDTWIKQGKLSSEAAQNLNTWLNDTDYRAFRSEIQELIDREDTDEIEDAFRTQIEFGTGGIRGKMGPGPNRINMRTIGEATQGLCQYIHKAGSSDAGEKGVVIAHDTRINSAIYSREVATIVAANNIRAFLFDGHRATPELSYVLRETNAVAGVVISASHNPPSDNGFKAYWSDGGQVVPPHDKNITAEVQSVNEIIRFDFTHSVEHGLIDILSTDLDRSYVSKLEGISQSSDRNIRIVYTPLHGVGATSIVPALRNLGYDDLHLVHSQTTPDGNFPTIPGGLANPEDPNTLTLAIQDASKVDADLVIASDPDADRLGCAFPLPGKGWDAAAEELALNGNQIGAILCHYLLRQRKCNGSLPKHGVVCETIVTSDLTGSIARSFGVEVIDNLLVGFKYIAEVIENLPADAHFLFGTEESHGYLADSFVRDKDAASAAILLCECTAQLRSQGKSVRQYLDEIYEEFGYYREKQKSTYREGAQGSREIAEIMSGLRSNPPLEIGNHQVVEVIDRQIGEAKNLITGESRQVEGVAGNVLAFTFTDSGHTRVTARPSGTEPKIKYYVSATSADHPDLTESDLTRTKSNVDRLAEEIINGMLKAAENALAKS